MIKTHIRRLARPHRCMPLVILAVMLPLASLGMASPALAKEPTGIFSVFKQCPRFTTGVTFCLYTQTLSGEVTLKKQTVPIEKTITLQGGIKRNEVTEVETFVEALNKETLSKTPQKVPGGLLGLVKCNEITGTGFAEAAARFTCELVFENGLTGVNAVTELAKPASEIKISKNNLANEEGTALSLPIKVHLENPLLGSECYIGSSAKPITLNLTSGKTSPPAPNKPINGKIGEENFVGPEFEFLEVTDNTLVDNAFSAPEATGCGGIFSAIINPLVDSKIGLPSAAGNNTAIQNNTIKEATIESVIASEK
jgi:hypothetical protein